MKITHSFRETNLVFPAHVMSWSSRKKKEDIFCTVYSVRRKFFNICAFSQCIVYRIHFQNVLTFTYQKALLHTLFCLFLKSSKAFSVSLSDTYYKHIVYIIIYAFIWFPETNDVTLNEE